MMTDLLIELLQEEEGLTLKAKPDSKGYWEIGYGHDLPFNKEGYAGLVWTKDQADTQLVLDAAKALEFAAELPYFDDCNPVRQATLGSMCYQLGSLAAWPKLRAALGNKDYAEAAKQCLVQDSGAPSDWLKETPWRACRESLMLATGVWVGKL
jgi:GH24 family phage-related lysozyme (muramidase)